MILDAPDLKALAARLDAITDRLDKLEVQVRALVTPPTVEAREFVVTDARGEVRARFEMQDYAPQLAFFDRVGTERLWIGLRSDGAPAIQAKEREIPLAEA